MPSKKSLEYLKKPAAPIVATTGAMLSGIGKPKKAEAASADTASAAEKFKKLGGVESAMKEKSVEPVKGGRPRNLFGVSPAYKHGGKVKRK